MIFFDKPPVASFYARFCAELFGDPFVNISDGYAIAGYRWRGNIYVSRIVEV